MRRQGRAARARRGCARAHANAAATTTRQDPNADRPNTEKRTARWRWRRRPATWAASQRTRSGRARARAPCGRQRRAARCGLRARARPPRSSARLRRARRRRRPTRRACRGSSWHTNKPRPTIIELSVPSQRLQVATTPTQQLERTAQNERTSSNHQRPPACMTERAQEERTRPSTTERPTERPHAVSGRPAVFRGVTPHPTARKHTRLLRSRDDDAAHAPRSKVAAPERVPALEMTCHIRTGCLNNDVQLPKAQSQHAYPSRGPE